LNRGFYHIFKYFVNFGLFLFINLRYGAQHPPFFYGPLQKAITEAFDNPNIEERRPLVLYLHHDDSVAAHIFPQNVNFFEN
jgi:hypothetical protein